LKDHYIVCGVDQVGNQVLNELKATKRESVMVDINIAEFQEEDASNSLKDQLFVEGNATQDATLLKAGIDRARGLFATTGDDALNIVISLTAKQLNPRIRVVARCNEVQNEGKIKKAGADAVVTPGRIGGLRMASEMTRQTVVSFLDIMLRDTTANLRVEEIVVPAGLVGKLVSKLDLSQYDRALLLAIKTNSGWYYNPPEEYTLQTGDILIVMATAVGRIEMEKRFLG